MAPAVTTCTGEAADKDISQHEHTRTTVAQPLEAFPAQQHVLDTEPVMVQA